jgi:hypothetical protein
MREQASVEIMVGAVLVLLLALYSASLAVGMYASARGSSGILSSDQNASLLSSNSLLSSCSCLVGP